MYDWIETYLEETSDTSAPEIFRLWAAITAISGVLERKVWTHGTDGPIFPNLFTMLVGPPSAGKDSAIAPVRNLWAKVQGLHLSPSNVTRAALIDALRNALRMVPTGDGGALNFSCMVIPAPEFGVFFTNHDTAFLSVLNDIYMSPPLYREERRTQGVIEVNKPYLVLLTGTQPDYINDFFPEAAWGMGFISRTIMVYAESGPTKNIIGKPKASSSGNGLALGLKKMFELIGEIHWTEEAAAEINAWHKMGCPPRPDHSKLIHYCGRRSLHAAKLSIISAVSRGTSFEINVDDFERAKSWLLAAEAEMPDIFRAMGAKSDELVIKDLHLALYRIWSSVAVEKRKPLKTQDIYTHLYTKVTSDRIPKLLDVAEKLGYIRRGKFPDEWVPEAHKHFGTM